MRQSALPRPARGVEPVLVLLLTDFRVGLLQRLGFVGVLGEGGRL